VCTWNFSWATFEVLVAVWFFYLRMCSGEISYEMSLHLCQITRRLTSDCVNILCSENLRPIFITYLLSLFMVLCYFVCVEVFHRSYVEVFHCWCSFMLHCTLCLFCNPVFCNVVTRLLLWRSAWLCRTITCRAESNLLDWPQPGCEIYIPAGVTALLSLSLGSR
jgi:hypothetical protein